MPSFCPRYQAGTTPAANAPPELVELGKSESVRLFDDDRRGIRDIDAHFDHRGGHEHIDQSITKSIHDLVTSLGIQSSVHHLDPAARERPPGKPIMMGMHILETVIGGIDDRDHDEALLPLGDPIPQMFVDPDGIVATDESGDHR